MRVKTIKKIKIEIDRLRGAIKQLEVAQPCPKNNEYNAPSRETAAVKRASMDLSRALTVARKPSHEQ